MFFLTKLNSFNFVSIFLSYLVYLKYVINKINNIL